MIAIINASPLIFLGKIGAIKLIPKLFSQIFTTSTVKNEVLSKKTEPEYIVLEKCFSDWLKIKEPKNQQFIKRLEELQIHSGEASIIALGKELQDQSKENVIIIDDLTAREIARTLELKITGTLGVILRILHSELANKKECKEYLRILIETTSFRISTELYSRILEEIEGFKSQK